jgi:hypothetical protein
VAGEQKLANRWYQALQNVLSTSSTQPTRTATQIPANTAVPTQSATTVPAGSGTGLTGQYYNNVDLSNLVLTRTDPTINFYWGTGSPASSIAADTYSVRWTGEVAPRYSQTYTFYTTSDDGVRLRVNGQLLIDNWTNHGPTENSGTISLQAGQRYNVQLDYYENDVGATLTLSWSSQSQAKQIIPQSQLFPASGTSSTPVPAETSVPTAIPTTASTGLYRAINLAGAAVTIDGEAWEAQASAANFSATVNGSNCWSNPVLVPTTDVNRFNMLRCSVYGGQMNLTLRAVPNGRYNVYLYIWEDNASVTTSISLEGAVVQSNYQTGAAGTWRRLGPWPVQISDGTIELRTTGSWVNLSGLEVRYAG